jgi:hypothetical protein
MLMLLASGVCNDVTFPLHKPVPFLIQIKTSHHPRWVGKSAKANDTDSNISDI